MKNGITFCLFVVLFFTFCKKKDPAPQTAATNTTTGPNISGGDHGTFLSIYNTTKYGSFIYNDSMVQVSFYDTPGTNQTTINAGTVSVNSTALQQFSNNVYSNTNQINIKSLAFQISGSGTIAATSFSYIPVYPIYTGESALPDTVFKTNGFSFSVTGITNCNQPVYVSIGQTASPITRILSTTPATITISTAELAGFTINQDLTIRLSLFNYSNTTLNSLQYGINANRTFQRSCYLKQ